MATAAAAAATASSDDKENNNKTTIEASAESKQQGSILVSECAAQIDAQLVQLDVLTHTYNMDAALKASRIASIVSGVTALLSSSSSSSSSSSKGKKKKKKTKKSSSSSSKDASTAETTTTAVAAAAPAVTTAAATTDAAVASLSEAQKLYYRAKLLDVLGTYQAEQEKLLSKAVKRDPSLIAAWNTLANCLWKKGNLGSARTCLNSALNQRKNKETYRLLSMGVKNCSVPESKVYAKNLAQSIKFARSALALDTNDGESWYVLGNALLADFFTRGNQDLSRLTTCLKAYAKAEECTGGAKYGGAANPDLYFNRANVFKYLENYQQAVADYRRARVLDPSLPAEAAIAAIARFVKKVQRSVRTRNGIKKKRFATLIQSVPDAAKQQAATSSSSSSTESKGESKGESSSNTSRHKDALACVGATRQFVAMSALQFGSDNANTCVIGVYLGRLERPDSVPVSFLLADAAGKIMMVSLYNVTLALLNGVKQGDCVHIFDAVRKPVIVEDKMQTYKVDAITVKSPAHILFNRRTIQKDSLAPVQLKLSAPTASKSSV
jgi:tetratricopeptide (TPR) repeat protein